jgi:hypothetical protein
MILVPTVQNKVEDYPSNHLADNAVWRGREGVTPPEELPVLLVVVQNELNKHQG